MQTQIQSCIQDVTRIATALEQQRRCPPREATTALARLLTTLGDLALSFADHERRLGDTLAAVEVVLPHQPDETPPANEPMPAEKTPVQKAHEKYLERSKVVKVVGNGGRTLPIEEQRYIEAELAWAKEAGWATYRKAIPGTKGKKRPAGEEPAPDTAVTLDDGLEKYRALLTKNARARVAFLAAGLADPERKVTDGKLTRWSQVDDGRWVRG